MQAERAHPLIGAGAIGFLLWQERLDAASPDEPLTRLGGGQGQHGKARAHWASAFRAQLAETAPTLQDVELEAVHRAICDKSASGLLAWLDLVRVHFGYSIAFDRRQPIIAPEGLRGWLEASTRIDPEVLICAELARQRHEREVSQLIKWLPIPRIADRQLEVLARDGLSDMHVHLGGMRHHAVIWSMVVSGLHRLQHIRPYAVGECRRNPARRAERDLIEEATRFVASAIRCLGGDPTPIESLRMDGCGDYAPLWAWAQRNQSLIKIAARIASGKTGYRRARPPTPEGRSSLEAAHWSGLTQAHFDFERTLLTQAFATLRDGGEAHLGLELALQRLIQARAMFMARQSQPLATRSGLKAFRLALDASRVNHPKPGPGEKAPVSLRLPRREHWSRLLAIASNTDLRRMELRIAPMGSVSEWRNFLLIWDYLERDMFSLTGREPRSRMIAPGDEDEFSQSLDQAERTVDIGFAVSFKRSLDGVDKRKRGSAAEAKLADRFPKTFAHMMDRDSAVLQHLRLFAARDFRKPEAGKKLLRLVKKIKRIDLSGEERDGFCTSAAFAMNLARGEEEALDALRAIIADEPSTHGGAHSARSRLRNEHAHWRALARVGKERAPLSLPKLAATCHAGEDYAHPLEGVCAIALAKEALHLCAGDTIGHGVALGHDVDAGGRGWIGLQVCRLGQQFDTLLWAYGQRRRPGADGHAQTFLLLEDALMRMHAEIYGSRGVAALNHLDALSDLWRLRSGPLPDPDDRKFVRVPAWTRQFSDVARRHFWLETREPNCCAKRRSVVALDPVFEQLGALTRWLQTEVRHDLAQAGIALEFNVSSNLRVNPDHTLAVARILQALGDFAQACLCTDDPGLFSTRIENEFAITLDALRAQGLERAEAVRILNRMSAVGRREVFWPEG